MKIYISGKISGLPFPEVKVKFQEVQDFLEDLGFDVVNPTKNGLTESHAWEQHIVRDVELLLPCEAIYMFDGWQNSVGACIEYDIAVRTGKEIWFESDVIRNNSLISNIQQAIHEATGLQFKEYANASRKREKFFARMLFAYHCNRHKIKHIDIAKHIRHDRTLILYLLKKYVDETKYNPAFRELAQSVDNILNKANNEA